MAQVGRIKKARKGEPIRARDYNQAPNLLNKDRVVKPPSQTDGARGVGRVKRFEITEISGDYLVCIPKGSGQESGETVYIARPYLLQRSRASHNEVDFTYTDDQTRTADDGVDTETQVVVPAYVVGDEIDACRVIGGAGVTTTEDDGELTVQWRDVNTDGRFWAEDPDA